MKHLFEERMRQDQSAPVFRGSEQNVPSVGTYLHRDSHEFEKVAVSRLNRPDCGLCIKPKWVVLRKGLKQVSPHSSCDFGRIHWIDRSFMRKAIAFSASAVGLLGGGIFAFLNEAKFGGTPWTCVLSASGDRQISETDGFRTSCSRQ